jgi:hypothetical protein
VLLICHSCLLNRGASCNIEDKNLLLPDSFGKQAKHSESMNLIMKARAEKAERVSNLIVEVFKVSVLECA